MKALHHLFVLWLLCFLLGTVTTIHAQGRSGGITVVADDEPLPTVFKKIEKQSKYKFIFVYEDISQYRTTVRLKNVSVSEALNKIIGRHPLKYTINDNFINIVLRKGSNEVIEVKGSVLYDEDGTTVQGATVRVNGKPAATTDLNGSFVLRNVPSDAILTVSYLGMEDLHVKASSSVNLRMKSSAHVLDNVVVTGYQELDRRKLSSSIVSVKMEDLATPSATSLDQMLQGRIAGIAVMNATSTPGVAPKIRIRGTSSITGNRDPLWVVDGIILDDPVSISAEELNNIDNVNFVGNAISGLNPSDIERIDVLKDVSATAIYGVKAANGVIVVTTRRGHKGAPAISYTGSMSLTSRPTYSNLNLMTSKERVEMSEEMVNRGLQFNSYRPSTMAYEGELQKLWSKQIDYDTFRENVKNLKELNTDWMKLLYRNALTQQHTVSVSGAGERMDYYLSLGYMNQQGANRYEGLDRLTAMLKVNVKLTQKLTGRFKISTTNTEANYPHSSISVLDYAYRTSRAIPAYNADGSRFYYDEDKTIFGSLPYNIFNELKNSSRDNKTRSTLINLSLDWKPLDWLKVSSLAGLNLGNTEEENWADERTFYISKKRLTAYGQKDYDPVEFYKHSGIPIGGELQHNTTRSHRYTWRNSIDVAYPMGNHLLSANVGSEITSLKYDGYKSIRYGYMPFRGKQFADIDIAAYPTYANTLRLYPDVITDNTTNTLSAYGTFTYSYGNKYSANFNIRTDGSNRFGQDKSVRFLPVWSVSGRWNVSEEKWFKSQKWIDELAFRASYGVQGNVHPDQTPNLIVRQENYNSTLGDFVSTLKQFPNRNLRWEKTISNNFGLDFAFFKNRVSGAVELYRKRGYDQIVSRNIAPSNGATTVTINAGDIENKGWELSLNVIPVVIKDWTWSLSFNTGKNYNQVINEGDGEATWQQYVNGTLVKNGRPVNSLYAYRFKGLDHNTGLPTFYGESEIDENGKTIINSLQEAYDAAFVYMGKREPDLSGGFSSSVKFKRFTFNALFSFNLGNKIRLNDLYKASGQALPYPQQNMSNEFVDRWQQPGDELRTNIPVLSDKTLNFATSGRKYPIAENRWEMYNKSDVRVVSGNFLRCRSISLRYEFEPALLKFLHIRGGSIALEGSNLFVLKSSKLKGKDPEQLSLTSGTIPPQQTYTCQIFLNF